MTAPYREHYQGGLKAVAKFSTKLSLHITYLCNTQEGPRHHLVADEAKRDGLNIYHKPIMSGKEVIL